MSSIRERIIKRLRGLGYDKMSEVDDFLRRVKRDLKKKQVCAPPPRRTPSPLREPTVHDRLGALADPELKAWVDAWDEMEAATKEARRQGEVAGAAMKKLCDMPVAENPEWAKWKKEQEQRRGGGKLDLRFNPLACDEDFFIPARGVA